MTVINVRIYMVNAHAHMTMILWWYNTMNAHTHMTMIKLWRWVI